uniref:CNDH2_C domain-containing protein n=1 Tax=Rhabditophanes sp. KR3021 TaxID=114890 RepID=A0AC35TV22_9BILA
MGCDAQKKIEMEEEALDDMAEQTNNDPLEVDLDIMLREINSFHFEQFLDNELCNCHMLEKGFNKRIIERDIFSKRVYSIHLKSILDWNLYLIPINSNVTTSSKRRQYRQDFYSNEEDDFGEYDVVDDAESTTDDSEHSINVGESTTGDSEDNGRVVVDHQE